MRAGSRWAESASIDHALNLSHVSIDFFRLAVRRFRLLPCVSLMHLIFSRLLLSCSHRVVSTRAPGHIFGLMDEVTSRASMARSIVCPCWLQGAKARGGAKTEELRGDFETASNAKRSRLHKQQKSRRRSALRFRRRDSLLTMAPRGCPRESWTAFPLQSGSEQSCSSSSSAGACRG